MKPEDLPILTIDGARFDDFAGFAREFSTLLTDYIWHGSLDAFNDILRGGFGTPEAGFILRWLNSERSRNQALAWPATIAWHEKILTTCHPDNRTYMRQALERARRHEGETLFDKIVEIIRDHGPGGEQASDHVYLELR